MLHEPQDKPLPVTAAAVVGEWLNTTPWEFATSPGTHVRHETRMTFTANGLVIFRSDSVVEREGLPLPPGPVKAEHTGTWTIAGEALIVDWPTRRTTRAEFTLVERRATDGETRVCLKSPSGGVSWRVT